MNEVRFHFESAIGSGFAVGEVWRAFASGSFELRHFTAYYGPSESPVKLRLREGDYWVRLKLPYGPLLQELINVPLQASPVEVVLRVPPPTQSISSNAAQFSAMPPKLLDTEVKTYYSALLPTTRKTQTTRSGKSAAAAARVQDHGGTTVSERRAQFVVDFPEEADGKAIVGQPSSRRRFSLSQVRASFFKWPRVPNSFRRAYSLRKDGEASQPFLEPEAYFNVALRYATEAEPVPVSGDGSSISAPIRGHGEERVRTRRDIVDRKYHRALLVVRDGLRRPELVVAIPDGLQADFGTLRISKGGRYSGRTLKASIEVDNPRFNALLQYMKGNDLNAAMQIVSDSVEILYAKFQNPFAAAAAGYVLIQAAPAKLQVPWHIWIGNLGRYFENLPDGEILHATLLLQRGDAQVRNGWDVRDEEDYFPEDDGARAILAAQLVLSAINKGPPLFRAGLSLLDSNIRILQSLKLPEDTRRELFEASRLLTWLSMRVDPIEPFSVFYLKA